MTSILDSTMSIWREVFEVPDIDVDANFFDLGGTSLKAMIIVGRVREVFRFDMDVDLFSGEITVRSLSSYIERELKSAAGNDFCSDCVDEGFI